jgi:hypothetical protein
MSPPMRRLLINGRQFFVAGRVYADLPLLTSLTRAINEAIRFKENGVDDIL